MGVRTHASLLLGELEPPSPITVLYYILLCVCLSVRVSAYGNMYLPPLNSSYPPTFVTMIFERSQSHAISGGAGFEYVRPLSLWHAGLYTKTTKPYRQICGGTVIAKHAILTAAHCFSQDGRIPSASDYAVAAGKLYRPWDEPNDIGSQKSDVKAIHVPPRYLGGTTNFQEDIALVILAKEFVYGEYVKKACLNFNPDFDQAQLWEGELGKIVGWGLTGENAPPSPLLQVATLPSIAIERCIEQSPVSFRSSITADKICAGWSNGTAVCRGDSGGGLVFPANIQGSLRLYLRGVASTSPTSENACNIYTWATFTHVLRHEHFIKSILPDIEDSCIESDAPPILGLIRDTTIGNDKFTCFC